jgi:hypothetical protein
MKWAFWIFLALYCGAMLLLAIGTFGWFGQEEDPLSAVFLLPLGLPWNILGERVGLSPLPVALLSPLFNLGIIYLLWRSRA